MTKSDQLGTEGVEFILIIGRLPSSSFISSMADDSLLSTALVGQEDAPAG